MSLNERPYEPPLSRRMISATTIGAVGFLCRSFLYTLNRTETTGLENFLTTLDNRKDEKGRTRGLVTVSNHTSVLDDPVMWGVIPFRYHWNPSNMRWSLGSYDICFKNGALSSFFGYGNTLPTHRAHYSPHGGLFQPTMTQAIRLLSDPTSRPKAISDTSESDTAPLLNASIPSSDPFSSAELTYTTTGSDVHPNPSYYPSRRHSWVHIFPEGMIHQHPDKISRYFKWGVARLILESEPCPDVLPIWIDGLQDVMDDKREAPRWLPRAGKDIKVNFGETVDREKVLEPFRQRWRELKESVRRKRIVDAAFKDGGDEMTDELGVVSDEELRTGKEAQKLRIELTLAVRNEVMKVRRASGLIDEDPKRGLAETWRIEGTQNREGEKEDGSVVRDM